MPNVWVASMFWGGGAEFDLLAVRCAEFDGLAKQVLVEGDKTFQGAPKPLRYAPRQHEFPDTVCYSVSLSEDVHHPMQREAAQRNALAPLVRLHAQPDDVVVLCDADEIPARATLVMLRDGTLPTPVRLGMKLYHYYLNLRITGGDSTLADGYWYAPIAVRVSDLRDPGGPAPRTPHWWRQQAQTPRVQNAGWSWSFLGTVESHIEKLHAWSHYEWSGPEYANAENIERARRLGVDWDFNRRLQHEWATIDDTYPAFIKAHPERFAQYVGTPPEKAAAQAAIAAVRQPAPRRPGMKGV